MSTPFKMKGFSGFGNSPIKQDVDLTRKKTMPMEGYKEEKKVFRDNPGGGEGKLKREFKKMEGMVPQDPVGKLKREFKQLDPKHDVPQHKKKGKKGWFGLPDLGVTEALDAMTKKQKKEGTGFHKK